MFFSIQRRSSFLNAVKLQMWESFGRSLFHSHLIDIFQMLNFFRRNFELVLFLRSVHKWGKSLRRRVLSTGSSILRLKYQRRQGGKKLSQNCLTSFMDDSLIKKNSWAMIHWFVKVQTFYKRNRLHSIFRFFLHQI